MIQCGSLINFIDTPIPTAGISALFTVQPICKNKANVLRLPTVNSMMQLS